MKQQDVKVWLINTGWTGGPYGTGSRVKLRYTRAMISAAMKGQLDGVPYRKDGVFGLNIPQACPGVPMEILNPRETWEDKSAYDTKAKKVARQFKENFKQYEQG